MTQIELSAGQEWSKGWKIVIASMFGIGLGLSPLPFYTLAILSKPIMAEFGWNLGEVYFAFAFMTLGVLVGSPVAGFLADKFGARRVALPSLVFLAIGMFCLSLLNGDLKQFYAIFLCMAIFGAGTLPITWTRAITNNFNVNRGLALGVALVGTGIFGLFAPALTQYLIDSHDWRFAYKVLATLPIIISLPIAFFLFHDPHEKEMLTNKIALDSSKIPGMNAAAIFKDWRFYMIGLSFFLIGFAVSGLIQIIKYILETQGYTDQMSASFYMGVGLVGLSVIFGRMIGGYLIDRYWAPGIAFILLTLPAIACLIFYMSGTPIWLNSIAIIFVGFAAGVEFDMMAFLISRYFGMKNYSRAFGVLYAFFGVGAGLAPGQFGKMLRMENGQTMVLIVAAALCVFGALSLLTIGKYRVFDTHGKQIG